MKLLGVFAVVALAVVCSQADGAETDVVRVFDPKLRLSNEQLSEALKKANLERVGFKKTVETTTETDESGKKKLKKTILYSVTDDCSKAVFWEGILEQRFPPVFFEANIGKTFVRAIQSRIKRRKTKSCIIGFEIHPQPCSHRTKRSPRRGCSWCLFCWNAKISYN